MAVIPDPLTTVTGRVLQNKTPVVGATVECEGHSGMTVVGGLFARSGRPDAATGCDVVARSTSGGVLLGGAASVTVVRGGMTSIGDVAIGPVPRISYLTPRAALTNSTVSNLLVSGANLSGSAFSFQSEAIDVISTSISVDGTAASLALNVKAQAGTFRLLATNSFGSSPPESGVGSRFVVASPTHPPIPMVTCIPTPSKWRLEPIR